MAYLDHAATTPVRPDVIAAIAQAQGVVGNASATHAAGRRARRRVEESREAVAAALDARPSEVVFTSGGTESDNLAVKGLYWARRAADPARDRVLVGATEHHAVHDAAAWLQRHEAARTEHVPADPTGMITPAALDAAIGGHAGDLALVSVMWANNEIGTVSPVADLAALAHARGALFHTDAVQALATVPVSFAASGADALVVTGHKIGGPCGTGALLLRRELDCEPLLHGGGQERDVRSGTLDVAGIVGFAVAVTAAVAEREALARRLAALRDRLLAGLRREVPDLVVNGHPTERLPGLLHVSFPGCEGDAVLMLLDAAGVEVSTGSACNAGVSEPSAVLLALGASEAVARGSVRFSLGHTSTEADVDAAVAARAVDAGHDVTGVHLALSPSPAATRNGARGCCTLDDARDARRAADVLGIPFYVWDMAERFAADVVEDFVAEYEAGRTPNPCLRCNEKVKFAAVLDRALALGFDGLVTGHHARVAGGRLERSIDLAKDQSYVLAVCTPRQLAHAHFPLGDSTKTRVRAEAAERGLAVADKPDSHDICFIADGDTRGFLTRRLGEAPGEIVDAETGTVVGEHAGTHGFTVGQRRGLRLDRPTAAGEPRYVLSIRPAERRVVVGRRELLDVRRVLADRPVWGPDGVPGPTFRAAVQLRAHGATVAATVTSTANGEAVEIVTDEPVRGIAAGQAAVFYDPDTDTTVLGSATVTAAVPAGLARAGAALPGTVGETR